MTVDEAQPESKTEAISIEKSIAVLPFVNMSSDPEQDYFSDGISEEILNALAKVQELKVAGRTSSFMFKGKNQDLRLIGETLGVSHILEGSVRKAGNQVRVTAQLIKADGGFHLWSANYDRELTNIFAIQDEIAGSIADALKVSLKLESTAAGNLTGTNSNEGFRDEALTVAHEVLSFAPNFHDALALISSLSIMDGDCTATGEYASRLVTALNKSINSTQVYLDLCQVEDPALRASAIQTTLGWSNDEFANPTFPTLSYDYELISIFSELNEFDSAWKVLEKATDLPYMPPWVRSIRKPSAKRFRCDSRVQQMIQDAGLPPAVHTVKCD